MRRPRRRASSAALRSLPVERSASRSSLNVVPMKVASPAEVEARCEGAENMHMLTVRTRGNTEARTGREHPCGGADFFAVGSREVIFARGTPLAVNSDPVEIDSAPQRLHGFPASVGERAARVMFWRGGQDERQRGSVGSDDLGSHSVWIALSS